MTIDIANNTVEVHQNKSESWKVTLLDTGMNTMTGGRIKQASPYIGNEDFLLTYGDGLSDVNISKLISFHNNHGKYITMTAVQPDGRYGTLNIESDNSVSNFLEKPKGDGSWINGGFFVCKPEVFETIDGDLTVFEKDPLTSLARENQLMAFKHEGFWKAMDTLKDKKDLNELWRLNKAPWKNWAD